MCFCPQSETYFLKEQCQLIPKKDTLPSSSYEGTISFVSGMSFTPLPHPESIEFYTEGTIGKKLM